MSDFKAEMHQIRFRHQNHSRERIVFQHYLMTHRHTHTHTHTLHVTFSASYNKTTVV